MTDTTTDADLALLHAEGWTPTPRLGWWTDPQTRRAMREWRALELARADRDARSHEVNDAR